MSNRRLAAFGLLAVIPSVISYAVGWIHGINTEIDNQNRAARAVFEERCTLANLYVSGSLGDWSEVYRKIAAGTFQPVLMDAKWSDGGDLQRASGVIEDQVRLEFLEPEQMLVLRNPMLAEKGVIWPIPMLSDGLKRTDCFHARFPKLEQFVWSEAK